MILGTNLFTDAYVGILEQVYLPRYAIKSFTNTEVKGLPTVNSSAPNGGYIEIIPAPGVNKLIYPTSYFLVAEITSIYTGISADAQLYFIVGPDLNNYVAVSGTLRNNATGNNAFSSLFASVDKNVVFMDQYQSIEAIGAANVPAYNPVGMTAGLNQPLVMSVYNVAGDLTGGNVLNKLHVIVNYNVIDLTRLI